MKRIVSVLLLLAGLVGCSSCVSTGSIDVEIIIEPAVRLPIALLGKFGAAHACPIAMNDLEYGNIVVSASHVLYDQAMYNGEVIDIEIRYFAEDQRGSIGKAEPVANHNYMDIAFLRTSIKDIDYFPQGAEPSAGDEMHWYEFDYSSNETAYAPFLRVANITRTLAGVIFFDDAPVPGASGSCLFDIRNEVVGVISFLQTMDDHSPLGGAVNLIVLED